MTIITATQSHIQEILRLYEVLYAALEVMIGTDAISSMIRENKVHQINSIIQTGMREGMQSLNFALARLVRNGMVSRDIAEKYSDDPQELKQYLL